LLEIKKQQQKNKFAPNHHQELAPKLPNNFHLSHSRTFANIVENLLHNHRRKNQ